MLDLGVAPGEQAGRFALFQHALDEKTAHLRGKLVRFGGDGADNAALRVLVQHGADGGSNAVLLQMIQLGLSARQAQRQVGQPVLKIQMGLRPFAAPAQQRRVLRCVAAADIRVFRAVPRMPEVGFFADCIRRRTPQRIWKSLSRRQASHLYSDTCQPAYS